MWTLPEEGLLFTLLVQCLSWCEIPGYQNDTFDVTSVDHQAVLNMSMPLSDSDSCFVYLPDNYTYDDHNQPVNATRIKCSKWVYDQSVFFSTVASQFNLVCDDSPQTSLTTMIFYSGFLAGTFVLGTASDILGRKVCLYVSLTLVTIMGTGLIFSNSFITFTILNFFVGLATQGIYPSAYVIGIELVGLSKRTNAGMITQLAFSTGVVSLAGLAFLIRDWQYLLVAITAPLIIFYFMWCFIPESPRWQIQKGHYSKARKTVLKAARVNKKEVPDSVLNAILPHKDCEKEFMLAKDTVDNGGNVKDKSNENSKGRLTDLFKSRVLFTRSIIIFFNWFVISLTFYGLNFNTRNLGTGSIFLNLFLAGLVEFPAHLFTLFTVDRLGRKVVHCLMLSTSGVACLSCVVTTVFVSADYQWITTTLAMIGKFGAAGCFGVLFMYSSEVFPTVIRNSALGISATWSRIGTILAPFIAAQGVESSGGLGTSLPLLICGCLIICAVMLNCLLPETLNKKLPETLQDAQSFTNGSSSKKADPSNGDQVVLDVNKKLLVADRITSC
ncbi:organic cation transporter protein-like isoform X2 [Physella acuta]|uniref:organic cation transporter protein-like isoform X2 n=1 Tax=Physella acuta TaxID=109671 RepID=UPI0027DE06DC|nr:organic cation transporter protein-like isoform X2 [Physella acuta]